MGRRARRLSQQERLQIVRMHGEGRSTAYICRNVRCASQTVTRVLERYRLYKTVDDLPPRRDPSCSLKRQQMIQEEQLIVAAIVDEPFLTASEIKRELGLPLTRATIHRRLQQHGLICLNNSSNRSLDGWMVSERLSFARSHRAWTKAQWRRVVFTNESTVCCKWDPNKSGWRGVHIWNDPVYLRQLKAGGYTCVNVLGVVTYDGLGPLIRSDESITPEQYVDVLNRTLMPYFLDGPFPDRGFLVQHDVSPTYTSDEVQDCIEANGIHDIKWPPRSEDISPIKGIWSCMKLRICKHRLDEPSADKLWDVVKHHWDLLTRHKGIVAKLYSSLPNKLKDVVTVRGRIL